MVLAVNIGNSYTSFGLFGGDGVISVKFKITSYIGKTSDEYFSLINTLLAENKVEVSEINGVIISSVVPQLTLTVSETLSRLTKVAPILVGPGVKTGFSIKIDNPSELGADMVANAAAVIDGQRNRSVQPSASVIIDMNTVTTVSAINKCGEYVGCAIIPGVRMSFDSMR